MLNRKTKAQTITNYEYKILTPNTKLRLGLIVCVIGDGVADDTHAFCMTQA